MRSRGINCPCVHCLNVQIGALPGQSPVASEILSPVLDDAIVAWSQLTHSCGLQLVRWTSHEYYLIGGLNPGGQQRPLVRIMADALLEMKVRSKGLHLFLCGTRE